MIYRKSITTSANTLEANKDDTEIALTKGIVHKLDITFPSGCQGYLHVAINHGLHQIWPYEVDQSFATDGETITFPEFYHIKFRPFGLMVYTWNLDDTYDHDVIIRIGILPVSAFAPWQTGWWKEAYK